jgi:hypothetical protein
LATVRTTLGNTRKTRIRRGASGAAAGIDVGARRRGITA